MRNPPIIHIFKLQAEDKCETEKFRCVKTDNMGKINEWDLCMGIELKVVIFFTSLLILRIGCNVTFG